MTDPIPPSPPERPHGPLPWLYWPGASLYSRRRVVRLKDAQIAARVAARDWGLPVYRLEAPRYERRCVVIAGGSSNAQLTRIARWIRAWVQANHAPPSSCP